MDIKYQVEALFTKLEGIQGKMSPMVREGLVKDAIAVEMRSLLLDWKTENGNMDPKLREMRLECLKLAAELGPVQYSKVGEQGVLCAEHLSVIDVAETYLKYVQDGVKQEVPQGT
jgi:hypothetical protein